MHHNPSMGELTAEIIRKTDEAKDINDIKDWLWMAGDLLRRASSPGFHSGFGNIDAEVISPEERAALKNALLRALTRNDEPGYVGSILSALSCSFDQDLRPLLVEYLTKYLRILRFSHGVVYTALLALKDLDEPVFQNVQSICAADIEKHVIEANAYLTRRGIPLFE